MPLDIVIPIYDDFTALDAVGPYEVLSRIGGRVRFIGREAGPVRTDNGMLTVIAEASFADAPAPDVVVVPGGVGTLDELFEAWTTGYLGMHDKPVVMLDPWGHYEGLLVWLNGLLDSGYISQVAVDRLVLVDKVGAAIEACAPV